MKEVRAQLSFVKKEAEQIANETNKKILLLGENTRALNGLLDELQTIFDTIRGIPSDKQNDLAQLAVVRLRWLQQVEKINKTYKAAEIKIMGSGAIGVSTGVTLATMGPSIAMGLATTFGVASTGTAISTLSGAAATNAALAWLGGGALTAGGSGMVAGSAILALAGPVGWSIIGLGIASTGIMVYKNNSEKQRLEDIFKAIAYRDIKSYQLATVELNERILRINQEIPLLKQAIRKSKAFGTNYEMMTEQQQYNLITFVNLMHASTQLLVNPVAGLIPKYTEHDLARFQLVEGTERIIKGTYQGSTLYLNLANLLYQIPLDKTDKKILAKTLKNNQQFLDSVGISRRAFHESMLDYVEYMLIEQYANGD